MNHRPSGCRRARVAATLFLGFSVAAILGAPARADVRFVENVSFLESGRTEKLDLYLPARAADAKPAPAVVWIHGGGFTGGKKGEARAHNVCETLAAAGYVCVSIDYRLGEGAWPTNLFDCKNAVRFLRVHAAEYGVDPARIAVFGGSAGAYLGQMVGFTDGKAGLEPTAPYPGISSAVKAVGNFYGTSNNATRQQPSPTGALTGVLADNTERAKLFGLPAGASLRAWRDISPVAFVTPTSPPVLIVHGLADPLSDYAQALELAQVLSLNGVPHELVMLEHVGHQFDLTTWNKKPLPRDLRPVVLDFLRAYGLAP